MTKRTRNIVVWLSFSVFLFLVAFYLSYTGRFGIIANPSRLKVDFAHQRLCRRIGERLKTLDRKLGVLASTPVVHAIFFQHRIGEQMGPAYDMIGQWQRKMEDCREILVSDMNGRVIFSTRTVTPAVRNVARTKWYAGVFSHGTDVMVSAHADSETRQVVLARPIRKPGATLGVVAAFFSEMTLRSVVEELEFDSIDIPDDNTLIYNYPPALLGLENRRLLQLMKSRPQGEYIGEFGPWEKLVVFTKVEPAGWMVGTMVDSDVVSVPLYGIALLILLGSLILVEVFLLYIHVRPRRSFGRTMWLTSLGRLARAIGKMQKVSSEIEIDMRAKARELDDGRKDT